MTTNEMTSPAIPSPKGEADQLAEMIEWARQRLVRCSENPQWGANVERYALLGNMLEDLQARRSSSSREEVRREALEEAAKVADEVAADEREEKMADKEAEGEDYNPYSYGAGWSDGSWVTAQNIAKAIRALSQGEWGWLAAKAAPR